MHRVKTSHLLEDVHLEAVVVTTQEKAIDPGEDNIAMITLRQN